MFSVQKFTAIKRSDPVITGKQLRDLNKLKRHKPSPQNRSIAQSEIRKELMDPAAKALDKRFKLLFAKKKKPVKKSTPKKPDKKEDKIILSTDHTTTIPDGNKNSADDTTEG